MSTLSEQACWELLERERVGRLGYRLVDELHVVPVSYVVRDGEVLIATGEGNKLLAAELHAEAALEIDDLRDEDECWSVLVRGRLDHVEEGAAEEMADVVSASWLPTLKYDVVRLVPAFVTGRRFVPQHS